ncbi:hypothetical protein RJ640_009499, partial [Escallonia rubra]
VLPDLFRIVCTCEDGLKEFITWKLGTLVSIVRQHIRKYLPELLSLVSELWSSFSLPATNRPVHGSPVQCGDTELEKKIDEKIEQFIDRVEKHPNKKNQICLSFYEVKSKQPSWFTNKVERLHWEQWYINLNVAQHPKTHSGKSHHSKVLVDPGDSALEERSIRRAALETSLREVLFQIIKFVNEKKDHVPPIPNLEGVSFPYEITISRYSECLSSYTFK